MIFRSNESNFSLKKDITDSTLKNNYIIEKKYLIDGISEPPTPTFYQPEGNNTVIWFINFFRL